MPSYAVTTQAGPKNSVNSLQDIQDIADFESKYGIIPKGSCVMVKTGWSKFWHEPLKYHNNHVFPSVSSEAASLLLERGLNALGIDTLSPDRPEDGFKVHKTFWVRIR